MAGTASNARSLLGQDFFARARERFAQEPARAPDANERQAIGEYVRAHLDPLVRCYDRRLREKPFVLGLGEHARERLSARRRVRAASSLNTRRHFS